MQNVAVGICDDCPEANQFSWNRSCSTMRFSLRLKAGWFRWLQWRALRSKRTWKKLETVSSGRSKRKCWHGFGIFYCFGNLFQQKSFLFFFESPTIITRMLWNPKRQKIWKKEKNMLLYETRDIVRQTETPPTWGHCRVIILIIKDNSSAIFIALLCWC